MNFFNKINDKYSKKAYNSNNLTKEILRSIRGKAIVTENETENLFPAGDAEDTSNGGVMHCSKFEQPLNSHHTHRQTAMTNFKKKRRLP